MPGLQRLAHPWLVLAACTSWAMLCFAPTLGFRFVNWDDPLHLTENPLVVAPAQSSLLDHLLTPALGYPSPVTVASYRLEAALFGLGSALPFHASNVLLHGAVVALVVTLGRVLGLGLAGSALSGLLFGLHPVVAEPVSWVSGRKDLLAALFALSALWLGMRRELTPRNAHGWLALGLFLLALLAKPVAAYLALVIFVWRLLGCRPAAGAGSEARSSSLRGALTEAAPFAITTLLVFPLAWVGQARTHSLRGEVGALELLRDAWYSLGFHLRLLLGLEAPSAKYLPQSWPADFTPPVDLMPLIVLPAIAALTLTAKGASRRRALAGLSFAVLAYLPTSNLIPLTRVLADVYVFMPLAGLCWWLGAVCDPLLSRHSSPPVRALPPVLVGAALTLPALETSAHWRNSVTLWANAYQHYPHDYRLCRNLGNARFELEGARAALEQYQQCAERFGSGKFDKNLGLAHAALGERRAAIRALRRAQRHDPGDAGIRRHLERLEAR